MSHWQTYIGIYAKTSTSQIPPSQQHVFPIQSLLVPLLVVAVRHDGRHFAKHRPNSGNSPRSPCSPPVKGLILEGSVMGETLFGGKTKSSISMMMLMKMIWERVEHLLMIAATLLTRIMSNDDSWWQARTSMKSDGPQYAHTSKTLQANTSHCIQSGLSNGFRWSIDGSE